MKRWKKNIAIVTTVLVSVGIGVVLTVIVTRPSSHVPSDIQSGLTFSPLVPTSSGTDQVTNYKLAKAEDGTQTLTYVMTIDKVRVVVSQYPQPAQFTDVPEYKERFLSSVLNQTGTVQTANGVIYVGQTDTGNRQIAVMLERGLLVFFNPSTSLSNETWRTIGDSLTVEKSTD